MKTGIFPEYLGDVSAELLLQNLTNTNQNFSSIDAIRAMADFHGAFQVIAEIERPVHESEVEPDPRETLTPRPGKLVRIVLEPAPTERGNDLLK